MNQLLIAVALFSGLGAGQAVHNPIQDWHTKLEANVQRADLIFVGVIREVELSSVDSDHHAVLHFDVDEVLKGEASSTVQVILKAQRPVRHTPDTEPSIWFLASSSTGYEVIGGRWSHSSKGNVIAIHARQDKTTRLSGMKPPQNATGPITLALGIPNGKGSVVQKARVSNAHKMWFRLQFENIAEEPHTVMPVLDGSDVKWRFPHYWWEIVNEDGDPVQPHGIARCGNVNPWTMEDFVELKPGQVFRTVAPFLSNYHFLPGRYKARVFYESQRNLDVVVGLPLGLLEKGVEEVVAGVWEGQLHSNWIEFTIEPAEVQE